MLKKYLILGVLGCVFLQGVPCARAGEVIDRIVATVNGHIILQSDWDDAVCFEAFTAGRVMQDSSPEDRKAALDHLIDQELLREQIKASDFPHASDTEISARVEEIRKQYPGAENQVAWHDTLQRYGLSENELKSRVALEIDLMRLVDARLRPGVQIDSKVIESYYSQELLPQLRQSGAKDVPLAEVTPKIKELLIQRKVNQLLTAWLHTLRAGSDIHSGNAFLPAGAATQ
jgi:peptidyl-prolyl cis-trans isomerase SurA